MKSVKTLRDIAGTIGQIRTGATLAVDEPEPGTFRLTGTIGGEDPVPLLVTRRWEQADAARQAIEWVLRACRE